MKTTNIFPQPTIKIALILVALLFSSGIFAQKSFKQFEIKNVSDKLIRSSSDIIADITSTFRTDVFIEKQISLEDWMMDLEEFATDYESISTNENSESLYFEEPKMEMEDWMMEPDWDYIKDDNFKEAVLTLENWMCCPWNWIK